MAKKKKIREEFDAIYKTGDTEAIKKMLAKNPWLQNEISQTYNTGMNEQHQVIAALGVMEDERGGAVPIDEIIFSLRVDFNARKGEDEVRRLLIDVEKLNLVKRDSNGWTLTEEGGKICDEFLNKTIGKLEL
jgi:hypothetical protein